MKLKLLPLALIFTFLTNCGFNVVNQTELSNFDISEIITTGDNKINYKIKNKLLLNSKKSEKKLLIVYLDTKKTKNVKERNIKNEITKYKIEIRINVQFKEINRNNKQSFTIKKSGDYNVATQYSRTLNNEKKLIEILTDDLSDRILGELIRSLNVI